MPIKDITNEVNKFEALVIIANKMSASLHGVETSSRRKFFASVIFARVVVQSSSLLRLASSGGCRQSDDIYFPIDIPSCASILRSMVELYRVFYYGAIDDADESEIILRHLKFELKSLSDREFILDRLNIECDGIESSEDNSNSEIEKLENEIKNNKAYKKLSRARQQSCINKFTSMYLKPEEIEEKAGLDKNEQDAIYRFLSSEAHANPMSIAQTAGNITVDNFSQLTLRMLLDYATKYLKFYIQGIAKVFPEQKMNFKSKK